MSRQGSLYRETVFSSIICRELYGLARSSWGVGHTFESCWVRGGVIGNVNLCAQECADSVPRVRADQNVTSQIRTVIKYYSPEI